MEEITLEKIDVIRQRTGLSYSEAKKALEQNNGDVVNTLIYLEESQKSFAQNATEIGNELVDTIKDIIRKGNVTRIRIKKDDRILIDIPVTAGVVTGALTLYNPFLLAVGAIAALVSRVVIEIQRPDGKVDVINKILNLNNAKSNTSNSNCEGNNQNNSTQKDS